MSNKSSDFSYPTSLTGGTCGSVNCTIRTIPCVTTNKHSIYLALQNGNYSNKYAQVAHGTYYLSIPQSWFNRTNSYATIQIDTYDRYGSFISGSFAHTVLLYSSRYKNYLSNFTHPDRTYPGETCTINILPPKDAHSQGLVYDIDINYHRSVGRQTIATNRGTGNFSFVVPELAINSSLTVRVTTKTASTKQVLGTIAQSIKIEKPKVVVTTTTNTTSNTTKINKPELILPDNYSLTLSEGEVVKIKGDSENINDYMIVYAKQPCNVMEAVKEYTTVNGYYAASQTDLKNKLLTNVTGTPSFYILKAFDADSTFLTQSAENKKIFELRTPSTNDYEIINDFYALQWFQDVEPGDLLYIYAIQRGTIYTTTTTVVTTTTTTTVTEPGVNFTKSISTGMWACRHCDLAHYSTWSQSSNWSPYTYINVSDVKSFILQYPEANSATFLVSTNNSCYPPTVFVSKTRATMYQTSKADMYLTPLTSSCGTVFEYNVPISYLQTVIAQGYSKIYFNTHWGSNSLRSNTFYRKEFTIAARKASTSHTTSSSTSSTSSKVTEATGYSDGNYKSINSIPVSTMTPYVVIPPVVKPIELAVKDKTAKQVTITYPNPLYNNKTESIATYNDLGQLVFDVSKGDDINDLSNLNPIQDADGNDVQVDKTLDVDINEKRLLTYEKSITIPSNLLESIRKVGTNDVYIDLHLKSIDNGNLNFKTILSSGSKVQIMFSKGGENKERLVDVNGNVIDYKKPEYTIYKIRVNRNLIIENEYDTIHLLYNTDKYDEGKSFNIENCTMQLPEGKTSNKIGLRKTDPVSNTFGTCTFTSDTFEIAKYALNYPDYRIRLCLENMEASSNLFEPPVIKVTHRNISDNDTESITETVLLPINQGEIAPGEDIHYDIPFELYNVNIDDILIFNMSLSSPYPINAPEITFSNAFIEVIGLQLIDGHLAGNLADKYTTGFTATVTFSEEKKNTSSTSTNVSAFDPVECIDVIMCCFDKNKNLINKTNSKRRDIYNGKEFVYFTSRRWHNFVNNKYMNHNKYKAHYDMTFDVPDGTEYYFFIAFVYSNWHDNPSIYSMSNILTSNSIKQDFSLEFINPTVSIDEIDGTKYANSDINNPEMTVKVNSQISSNMNITNNMADNGFNLARDKFDRQKWEANPIIYSNTKQFGYELPIFNAVDAYNANNVVNSLEPLYNDIEYYYQWKDLYGKEMIYSSAHVDNSKPIEIDSRYTVYEDEADKFISNRAVPYIELPAELASYDRSRITLFLDTNFGKGVQTPTTPEAPSVPVEQPTKLVTETFTINYTITRFRYPYWGVKDLWNKGLMNKLGDIAAIEDIKIEWGMKLNRDHRHPTAGRRGPILVEDFWAATTHYYNYNPLSVFAWLKDKKIRDYGGHDIWHKNYGDYIYFEITNTRLKRLFLESNCHCRRHDAIMFEDYKYDWCWDTTVKVRFTVTKRVNADGTPLYNQNLPDENFTANYNIPGWDLYQKPRFKVANVQLTKAPTATDSSFVLKYDVLISPLIWKHTNANGDAFGNIFKYGWGNNAECYRKWDTITVRGNAPYTHEQTHYFITYNKNFNTSATFRFTINRDGTVTQS